MPRLDPRITRLRNATCAGVQNLIDSAECDCERTALIRFLCLAKRRRLKTGFKRAHFGKIYQQYRDWKRSPDYECLQISTSTIYRKLR